MAEPTKPFYLDIETDPTYVVIKSVDNDLEWKRYPPGSTIQTAPNNSFTIIPSDGQESLTLPLNLIDYNSCLPAPGSPLTTNYEKMDFMGENFFTGAGDYVTLAELDVIFADLVASTTDRGLVELATNAETITGTDTERAVTPAALQAKVASETEKGIVELATNAEVATGTDTSRAITAAGATATFLKKYTNSILAGAWVVDGLNATWTILGATHGRGTRPLVHLFAETGAAINTNLSYSYSANKTTGDVVITILAADATGALVIII